MKKLLATLLILIMISFQAVALEPPELIALSSILIDVQTGQVLFENNADAQRAMASITKVMTGILALEHCAPGSIITVSEAACYYMRERGGDCYLIPGEEVPFEIMMRYLLIVSGNEGANALAEHVSGSMEKFVELMNEKAAELGMVNTQYRNAHGLHEAGHYSSARDIATLVTYAMKNPDFAQIVTEPSVVMPVTNKHSRDVKMYSTNMMNDNHTTSSYLYEGIKGVKTGYSGRVSGLCFAGAMEYDGRDFYSVVLGCEDRPKTMTSFTDTIKLFDYAKQFRYQPLTEVDVPVTSMPILFGISGRADVVPDRDIGVMLPGDVTFSANDMSYAIQMDETNRFSVKKGEKLGTVTVSYDGVEYGTAELIASESGSATAIVIMIAAVIVLFAAYLLRRGERKKNRR